MRQDASDTHSHPVRGASSVEDLPSSPPSSLPIEPSSHITLDELLSLPMVHTKATVRPNRLEGVIRMAGRSPRLSRRGGSNHAGVWGPVLRELGMALRTVPRDGVSIDRRGSILWLFVPQNHEPFERWLNPHAPITLDLSDARLVRAESFRVRLGERLFRRIDLRKKIGRHTFSGWWVCTGITSPEKPTHILRAPTQDLPAYLQEIHTWRAKQKRLDLAAPDR